MHFPQNPTSHLKAQDLSPASTPEVKQYREGKHAEESPEHAHTRRSTLLLASHHRCQPVPLLQICPEI